MNALIDIIGESPPIVGLRHQIDRLLNVGGRRLPPILIEGETGTGKGLLARSIHRASARSQGPFVDVNCSAIPESLVESELFGFERSAFTDARQAKAGLFQTANGGTIFLDEIGTLPLTIQTKLLKAIEDREVRRLGATRSEPFDAWIMAATNEDLKSAVDARRFRADLYHRIAAVMLWMAPLRTRGRDVLLLAERFLERLCAEYGRPPKSLTTEACVALLAYPWPGNVRELSNLMERVALLSEGTRVTADMLGLPPAGGAAARPEEVPRPVESRPLPEAFADRPREAFERSERERLLAVLHEVGGNISRAATKLGIPRNTLRYRLARLGLGVDDPRITRRRDATVEDDVASLTARLPAPRRAEKSAPAPIAPERRRLTFLRVAAQAWSETMGPSAESRIFQVVGDKIRTFYGHVVVLQPGLAVTVFGVDVPDDGPSQAVHAAVAIRQAGERERERGFGFGIVASIHTAECLVTRAPEGPEISPADVEPVAALLATLAEGAEAGTIALSDAAAKGLEGRFDLVPTPVGPDGRRAARLGERARPDVESGVPSPFVGRARELATLQELLSRVEEGAGQVVGVVGEPGIGKTRLVQELRQTLDRADVTWLETRCETYGVGIPYLPLCGLLRQLCGIGEFDTSDAMRDKLGVTLHHAAIDGERWAPYVLHLLGVKRGTEALASLSPEAVQARTAEALAEIWLKTSQRQPLVIAIEDLQFIDKASDELLGSLARSLPESAIMLLTTYRPGHTPPWMSQRHAVQLTLPRLAPADARRIVDAVTGHAHASVDAATVLAKAEGNPLFLEEVTRALVEHGNGSESASIPDTVQDVIVDRLRRLSPGATGLLQAAAVMGREVALKLLFAVWGGGSDEARAALAELKRLELLVERSRGEQATVRFKHVLTQEVVYRTLPETTRATLHAAAGHVLESLYAGRADEACDVLAYHYGRSGEAAKAVSWLSRAAQRAFRLNALEDTLETLRHAGEHVARIDDFVRRERLAVEVVHQQVFSLVVLGRLPMAVELLDQHTGSVERLADAALAARHFFWLGFCHCLLGDLQRAEQDGDRALSEAWRSSDRQAMGKAHFVLELRAYSATEPRVGVEHGEQAAALLDPSIEGSWLSLSFWILGANYGELGEPRRAIECERRALAIAEAIGDRRARSYASTHLGFLHAALGEQGIPACEQGLDLAPDPFTAAIASGYLGYAHLQNGNATRAIELLTGAVDFLSLFHHRHLTMWFTALVAEAHLLDGQIELAHARALEAHGAAQAAHFPAGVNYAEWVLGRIAQARGDGAGVERWRASFHSSETKVERGFWRGRELFDLARCAHVRGERDRAAAYLRSAHDVFLAADAPRYLDRAVALAHELGITLGARGR